MELWKKENLKHTIPYLTILLLGWLWGSVKNELPAFLNRLSQNISPQLVSAIALSGYLLSILIGCLAFKLLSENQKLKSKPDEGILKLHFGVHWKVYLSTGEVGDTPYCGCCSPPKLLANSNVDTTYLCLSPQNSDAKIRYYPLYENGNPITFQQAYQKVKDIYKKKHTK